MRECNMVVVIGSNTSNSNTSRICNRVFQKLNDISKKENKIKLNIFISSYKDLNVLTCNGCQNCFRNGKCQLDSSDYIGKLKSMLISADIIVFASPVYVNFVSGAMKNIVDRLGYWLHTMYLSNKKGFILTNTGFSGLKESNEYLFYVLTHLGVCVQGIYDYKFSEKDEDDLEKYTTEIAIKIHNIIIKDDKNINNELEQCFDWVKNLYQPLLDMENPNYEIEFWKKNNLEKIDTFSEFIENIKR